MNQEVKVINGYKIKDETARESIESINTDIDIINTSNPYYDEITYTKERHYDADCYITTIPKYDSNHNQIDLYVGDCVGGYTPLTYAQKEHTTLTINASLTIVDSTTGIGAVPSIISNGEIIRQNDMLGEGIPDYLLYLGIKADRSISEYKVNETTAQDMIDDGVLQAFDVFWKLVDNGEPTDLTDVYTNEGVQADERQGPRQCIGIKGNGDIIILTCDGRVENSPGLYSHEQQQILIDKGCVNAWNLDGGGSTSTTIKGSKINRNVDGHGTKDRAIRYTLNAKKQNLLNPLFTEIMSKIGEEKQNLNEHIMADTTASKVRTLVTIDGYYLGDLYDTEQDYYPIAYDRKTGNEYSTELVELVKASDEDTLYTRFKINKTGYFKITSNVEVISRAIKQHRISLYRINNNYKIPGSDIGNSSTLETAQRIELCNTGFINNRSVDYVYELRLVTDLTNTIEDAGCIMIEEM